MHHIFEYAKHGFLYRIKEEVEKGVDINMQSHFGDTPLTIAASNRKRDVVEWLVNQGTELNVQNTWGQTALLYAAQHEERDIAKLLLSRGADPNIQGRRGRTVLMVFAARDFFLAAFLINKGVNINIQDDYGNTALMWASAYGEINVIELLISKGAKINTKNKNGKTASKRALENMMTIAADYLSLLKGPLSLVHITLNLIEEKNIPHDDLPEILFQR